MTSRVFLQAFNIGSHSEIRVLDCLVGIQKILAEKGEVVSLTPNAGGLRRTLADLTKARHLLGYRPNVPFKEGLRRTVNWFLKNAHCL